MVTRRTFKTYNPAMVETGTHECRGYIWKDVTDCRNFSLRVFYNRELDFRNPCIPFKSPFILTLNRW